jgi:DNA repair exonuclease SbcCD ATPase subunit/DNA repair exonuclease SbcCD nuclease subunit
MQILASDSTGPVTHLLHFADIHIRNGDMDRARYDEYHSVLERTLADMDAMPCVQERRAVTVIAGDLFHNKGRLDTPALKLYFWWMDQLLSRTPVLVICGNHDFKQEDPRHPDILETVVQPYARKKTTHPLYYLKDTGHYVYGDIGFGVVSVRDTLRAGSTSGLVRNLPSYPNPEAFGEELRCKVALFHGSISQDALPAEARKSDMTGYPLEWFRGYDAVMLGDIHKQQLHQDPMMWGYPGSLVQQDFGEPTYGHGYIVWELMEGAQLRASLCHVPNDHGMITIKWCEKENDYLVLLGRRECVPVARASAKANFPKRPRVRILGTPADEAKVRALLDAYGIQPLHLFSTTHLDASREEDLEGGGDVQERLVQLSDLNAPAHWIEYLAKLAPELEASEWLLQPHTMKLDAAALEEAKRYLPGDLAQKLVDRNTRIQKAIDEYQDVLHSTQGKSEIVLKHMSWDYAMCYGPGNYFDFEKIENTVALLNGRNAVGKSSFLDVLCIGLFGEPTKHRNMLSGKKMTAKMIHDQRPSHKSVMRVNILFALDGVEYEITRSFSTQKKDDNTVYAQLHNAQVARLATPGDRTKKTLVCEGSVAVDTWVSRHFGEIDDLLMSTIVCQLDLTNFFYLKQDEQKRILDHALHLGSIAAFGKVLKEALLAHNEWLTLVRTSLQTLQSASAHGWVDVEGMEQQQVRIAEARDLVASLEDRCNALLSKIGNVAELPDLEGKELQKQVAKVTRTLEKYNDVEDGDMELCLMVKGEHMSRFESLRAQVAEAATEAGGLDELPDETVVAEELGRIQEAITAHEARRVEPGLSRSKLAMMRADLAKWAAKYPAEWSSQPDDLHSHLEALEHELRQHRAYQKKLAQRAVAKPDSPEPSTEVVQGWNVARYKEAVIEWATLKDKRAALAKAAVVPVRPEEGLRTWEKEWAAWCREVAAVQDGENAKELQERYDAYVTYVAERRKRDEERQALARDLRQSEAEMAELEQIPFNPECWACQKQPSAIRQAQLQRNAKRMRKLLSRVEQYLEQCEEHGSLKEVEAERASLEATLAKRKYFEAFCPKMEAEHKAWEEAKAQWKANQVVCEELAVLDANERALGPQVIAYEWRRWREWSQALRDAEEEVVAKSAEIEKIRAFFIEFDTREKDMLSIQEEEDRWEASNAWEATLEGLRAKEASLRAVARYWTAFRDFTEAEKQIRLHGENIERVYAKKRLLDELQVLERTKLHHEWQAAQKKLVEARANLEACQKKLTVMQTTFEEQKHQTCKVEWMRAAVAEWAERKRLLAELEAKFIGDKHNGEGYKEWIYRERVVPLVMDEVNRFLSRVESIRLKMTYDKKCFLYFLEDRGNTPSLDKASGYQNFVVGLAMRLALARIGAVGQNVRHLFIDEGFTACDVANIEKVPALLRGIMEYGGYRSILLMSHLEPVQDAAEVRIPIERRGVFSFIKWGDAYPALVLEAEEASTAAPVKKRGRPKKTVVE